MVLEFTLILVLQYVVPRAIYARVFNRYNQSMSGRRQTKLDGSFI